MLSFSQASVTALPSVALQLPVWLLRDRDAALTHALAESLAAVLGGGRSDIADQFPDILRLAAFQQRAHLIGGLLRPSSAKSEPM